LTQLKQQAEAAARAGDVGAELAAWRAASALLPEASRQHAFVLERIDSLARSVPATPAAPDAPPTHGPWRWLGGLGTFGVVLWKFKFLIVALATKGKLLVLGLTKAGTFFSMLLAFGVYWTAWGGWFALGFILSIYVHEMGHVAALRRYGIDATAPMFIPGVGAFVRLRAKLAPYEDARVGLAGPLWGLGAAIAAVAASLLGGGALMSAIAHTGAWINLFNLMPVWQLDGNRGFAPLTRAQRWIVVAAFAIAWALTHDGLLVLLTIVAATRALDPHAPTEGDRPALAQFAFIVLALALVFRTARVSM
jgi:Zn-dependent protease